MPKEIPGKEKIRVKQNFIEHYSKLTNYDEFIRYSLSFLRRSIRVNTLKISVDELKKRLENEWKLEPVPWCKEGFFIEGKRRDIGNLTEHFLGYFYVQEAVSMIPPIVLEPKPYETVLDMCAAPGSKASQIAQYMQNRGVLVCNDYKPERINSLSINMQRMGVTNAIITLMGGHRFKGMQFDRILLDAPCSGTGTIRKSLKTLLMWNPNMTKKIAKTQKQLIEAAFGNLKEGGTLVYSTCSLEPEENEGVIDFLLNRHSNAEVEEIKLNIKRSPTITEFNCQHYNEEVKKCLRLWPQDNDSEGFFVAKLRKI